MQGHSLTVTGEIIKSYQGKFLTKCTGRFLNKGKEISQRWYIIYFYNVTGKVISSLQSKIAHQLYSNIFLTGYRKFSTII